MNTRKQTRYQAVLERMSFGAVPIDGIYWLDPTESVRAASHPRRAGPDKGQPPVAAPTAGAQRSFLVAFPWLRALRRP
ncbi:MAG: hypothetical protein ACJ8R9_29025 [Steroidobacteraceae bacterium]